MSRNYDRAYGLTGIGQGRTALPPVLTPEGLELLHAYSGRKKPRAPSKNRRARILKKLLADFANRVSGHA
jgi:hypothetical protein